MDRTQPGFPTLDLNVPSVARMYDYLLGGKDHYAADRLACAELLGLAPGIRAAVLHQRRFLERAVRHLAAEAGVRQFIVFGAGIPARHNNVHEIAQEAEPRARVVYVDNDPVVAAFGRKYLERGERVAALRADLRRPGEVFAHPRFRERIDVELPAAVLLVSVLHCLPGPEGPREVVDALLDRLAPGSFAAISQLASARERTRERVTRFMRETAAEGFGDVRAPEEVAAFFGRLRVLPPGLGDVAGWRPDSDLLPRQCGGRSGEDLVEFGGVGRLP
ncbi:SAM-dependent methyltransferase [Streptomyces sp. DSM 44917]|uniref:SAM-dependent methyltransferase n=1 Tax=Streptomyces boetiae TaxID=3075541 RepID=A0ABU2L4A6_9ACTN|nr:SAM-dependent methyltransferase [Streptomyces sp. DSM 44917]MDT0306394.1 SAM-dependent methyltransferase [Streptomyces sp. DSM 44917]